MITQQELKQILHYDKDTGIFTWLVDRHNAVKKGNIAGSENKGYVIISINKRKYGAHRLSWLYETGSWPKKEIDHKNGNPSDNRFCNLREANSSQNKMNSKKHKDSASGFKGVFWHKASKKWQSQICIYKKRIHLGLFSTKEAAAQAYKKASLELHGKFSNLK